MASSTKTIPRFPSRHPLGHLPAFRDDALGLQRRIARAGELLWVRMTAVDSLWVSSASTLREVLVDRAEDYEKAPAITVLMKPVAGDGLLASQGSRHKRRRAIVSPALQPGTISRYAESMVRQTDRLLDGLAASSETDLGRDMMQVTLEIVADTILKTNLEGDLDDVERAVHEATQGFEALLKSPIPLPPTRFTSAGRKILKCARELDRIVYRIIAERRRGAAPVDDVLSMLLDARDAASGEVMDDDALRDEVTTLFLAGHETTANALTWALQLLGTHPEAARKLQREADALEGRTPGFADLPQLPYAACVFKEAMRLYPPGYLMVRRALTDTRIGPHVVPRGTLLFGNVYAIHRSPDTFEAPDEFRPERFAGNAERAWPRGSYVPFGAGPRVCVGNHFAMMEGQLILTRLAQRLELEGCVDGLADPEPIITIRPKQRVRMRLRPRSVPTHTASAQTTCAS